MSGVAAGLAWWPYRFNFGQIAYTFCKPRWTTFVQRIFVLPEQLSGFMLYFTIVRASDKLNAIANHAKKGLKAYFAYDAPNSLLR